VGPFFSYALLPPIPKSSLVTLRVVAVAALCMLYSRRPHFPSSPSPLFDPPEGFHFETPPQKAVTRPYGQFQHGDGTTSS
jgi:hypothetical protein